MGKELRMLLWPLLLELWYLQRAVVGPHVGVVLHSCNTRVALGVASLIHDTADTLRCSGQIIIHNIASGKNVTCKYKMYFVCCRYFLICEYGCFMYNVDYM